MNISSKAGYPACALSNFAAHPFIIDGILCNSMEGFLQGTKFKSPEMQEHVCSLVGFAAKKKGAKKNWTVTQTLYWRGVEIKRESQEYQDLLDRAYDALYENSGFRDALTATGNAVYKHSMGKNSPKETVLTTSEFCSRLTKLRDRLKNKK